ncbi:hypothetical protein BV25DRAFT_1823928 [Artomyces pyxidatus]|uniref:Uncharacterized protein n=1 Tax=Artomyces pyxidatus TaxID=48021 RepID=A0ACB8T6T0_9AGAM|nr:hypothetical protein BV25DRAFT_1823928 [Artomyces pyxidatus]
MAGLQVGANGCFSRPSAVLTLHGLKQVARPVSIASIRGDLRLQAREAFEHEYEAILPALESLRISQKKLEEDICARKKALEDQIHASRKVLEDEILASRRALDGEILSTRQALEDEVRACHRALAAIRTRSNSLAPAAMLPSDILALVFESLALDQPPGLDSHRRGAPNAKYTMLGWITATHVCTRWRQVALDIPTLWNQVTPELGFAWFKRMLTRSRKTPISITLRSEVLGSKEKDYLEMLADHLFRTRSLTVSGHFDTISSSFFPHPVPQLQTLKLHSNWSMPENLPPIYQFFNLPSSLREISFSNFSFSWNDIPACHNLTRLTVTTVAYDIAPRTSSAFECDIFLDFLRSSPNLESLILKNTFIGLDGHRPSSRIRLPHLSELVLRERWANLVWLLERIEVPKWTKLHLHASTASPALDDSVPVLRALAPVLGSGVEHPPSFHALSMEYDYRGLCFAADPLPADDVTGRPSFTHLEHDPRLLVRLSKPRTPNNTDTLPVLFQNVFDTLAAGDLQALSLDLRDSGAVAPLSAHGWAQILPQCSSVVHLRVYGVRAGLIFDLLGCRRREIGISETNGTGSAAGGQIVDPPLLPNLQSLDVRYINDDDLVEPSEELWYTRLLLALGSRKSTLPSLKLLEVVHCTFDDRQSQLFEELVEEMVWDGDWGEASSEYEFEETLDVWDDREGDDWDSESDEEGSASDEERPTSDESDGLEDSDYSDSEDPRSDEDGDEAVAAAILLSF